MKSIILIALLSFSMSSQAYLSGPTSGGGGAVDSVNTQTGIVVLDAADVGADPSGSAADVQTNLSSHTSNVSNPHSVTKAQVGLPLVENKSSADLYAAAPGVLPSGVYLYRGNKFDFWFSKDGLVMHQQDSATQTSPGAGAYNGAGVGNKGFVEFWNYENLALSALTSLKFTAKNIRDANATPGYLAWNILVNFNNGFLTAANDYAILTVDGAPDFFTMYYILTSSHVEYSSNPSKMEVKAVGGTGVINFTGNTSSGSDVITSVSVPGSLTVGMYVRKLPTGSVAPGASNPFSDGATITAIDVGASTVTVSEVAAFTGTTTSFKQYGGISPVDRSVICSGTSTITGVTNTADLQVNMKVTGTGVPANSYIVSLVANTSITLNNSCTAGSPTISFFATGKTGIPGNSELVGIPMSRVVANNPSAFITNNAPMTPIWTAADGGAPKNVTRMGGVQLVQASTSITNHHMNVLKNVTINSDVYEFAK